MKLSGNKILITGATAGIGTALLNSFLVEDNQIIAVGKQKLSPSFFPSIYTNFFPYPTQRMFGNTNIGR